MVRRLLTFLAIVLITTGAAFAQTGTAIGTVVDGSNQPLIGANVVVKGTTIGTISDINGNFKLTGIPVGQQVLVSSFIGYANEEKPVSIIANQEITVSFTLVEDIATLEELIVVGYGTQKKEDKTGAVAQIKSDELIGGAVVDPLQAITGKAAGVVVTKGGGNPTDDAKVKIRGSAGISGATNTNPLYVIDGVPGADINMISPSDIETYNILKDAASTAIYGSQGANGVILITTKKGKAGTGVVNFSSITSMDVVARKLDFLSASDYRSLVTKYGLESTFNDGGTSTDWQDEIFRTAIGQQYNLNASGGNDKSNYYASISHQKNEGIIQNSSRERTLANINFGHTALEGKLVLNGGFNVSFEESNLVLLGSNSRDDILYQTYRRNPTDSAYSANGDIKYSRFDANRGFDYVNPLAVLNDETRVDERKKLLGNASAEYEIIDGLKYKVAISYLSSDKEYTYFRPDGIWDGQGDDSGEGQRNYEVSTQKTLESTLNYHKTISDMHNLDVVLGYSWQENHFKKFGVIARGSQSATVETDNLASFLVLQPGDATSEANMSKLIGFFGRVAYNYNSKYYLGGSIRRDGSSKFGENNRWGLFPTASAGWTLHKEDFLSNVSWISQLKLRASYGVSGNQAFGSYFSKTIYEPTDVVINPGTGESVLTWSASRNSNPNLKWEKTAELNGGIDFGFFSDKISGTLEIYSKHTTDMLNEYSVPSPPAKYNKTWDNRGEMTNKGIELFLTAYAVDMEEFDWKTTFGFSKNVSKITDLGEGWNENDSKKGYISGQGIVGSDNWTMYIDSGQPLGNFYLFEYAGIQDGKAMYINRVKAKDNEPDTVAVGRYLTIDDRYVAGNATPKMELSWSNNLKFFEKWSLDFSFRGLFGQDVYNHTNSYFSSPIFFPNANVTSDAKKYMDEGFFGQFTAPSDEFLEKGTFIRLDYLALSYTYTFQNNKYIKNIKLSAMGNNLFVISKYKGADPEMTIDGMEYGIDKFSVYPKSRTLSFGINATF